MKQPQITQIPLTDKEPEVSHVNHEHEIAVLDNFETVQVIQWLDDEGDPCSKDENPICAVAGPDAHNHYYVVDLTLFKPAYIN
jgi:hypothetical protein